MKLIVTVLVVAANIALVIGSHGSDLLRALIPLSISLSVLLIATMFAPRIAAVMVLTVASVIALGPLIWLVGATIKEPGHTTDGMLFDPPSTWTLVNFENLIGIHHQDTSYRADGVDLEPGTDTAGGYDVAWTAADQWMKYTVNVPTAGTYTIGFRVAAPTDVEDAFHVADAAGNNLSGSVEVTPTGGWRTWETVTTSVVLPAGPQVLTLDQDAAGWNLNSMTFGPGTPTPTDVVSVPGNAQAGLTWTSSPGATSYSVFRGTAGGEEDPKPLATGIMTASFTDTGLTNGSPYYYTVAAAGSLGTSPASGETSTTPVPPGVPGLPTGLAATAGNAKLALDWTAGNGATSYNIFRGTAPGHEGAVPYKTGIDTTSYTDTGLTNGATYYYTVVALNSSGSSSPAVEVRVTPVAALPAAPIGVAAMGINGHVSLYWTPSDTAASYSVYRGTSSGEEPDTSPIATGITTPAYTDSGVGTGTPYYYTVTATNLTGASGQSTEAVVEAPFGGTPPAIPGVIKAANYDTGGQDVAYSVPPVQSNFVNYLINNIFVTDMIVILQLFTASLGGFALAKYQFKGKAAIMGLMLATMMLPGQVTMAPLYDELYHFHMVDNFSGLIIPGMVTVFGMFLFRQSMQQVPDELLQAARIDGCSEFRIYWDIVLPISRPMIGAFCLMSFMFAWNNFLWPQILLHHDQVFTLPIGLNQLSGIYSTKQEATGMMMAGTFLSVVPVMILFLFLQKEFVAGLTAGAVKG